MIYNPLFYHIYELALRSKSNRDMPMFVTILVISICFMFNVFAVFLLLDGLGIVNGVFFPKEYRIIGTVVFMGLVSFYYLYGGRYKKLYDEYSKRYDNRPSTFKAILVVVAYYLMSFLLMLLSGMFRNGDWIFSSI